MQAQHAAVVGAAAGGHMSLARRPVSVVVDSACDLADEVVRAHGMQLVPLNLIFESQVLRDRFDISAEEFVGRLKRGAHPTTSQPAPGAFMEAFRRGGEEGEAVVAVLLSGAISGTFASAQAAARQLSGEGAAPLHLFDSRGLSLLTGLLALKASELGEMGRSAEQVMAELERIRGQSGFFVVLDSFERALASGRIGRGRAWLGSLLDIKPVLDFDHTGKLVPVAKVRGRPAVLPKMLQLLEKKVPRESKRVRFGITHVAFPEILDQVIPEIRKRFGEDVEILTATATPVLATHAGEGAWAIAYMVED
jgi:DegV family protein with EDD domain